MEKLLSVTELADRLGLSKAAIYTRTWKRAIPFIRIGNRPRFREADIERWLNEQTIGPRGVKGKRRIAEKGKKP